MNAAPLRADLLAVARGLARSRSEAQSLIAQGRIGLAGAGGGLLPVKPSQRLAPDAALARAASAGPDYVSRGGLKLAAALATFGVAVRDRLAADIGQSTGGFTDCLLQAGAGRVVGVEVGHGQLAPSLRDDPRVVPLEHLHVREATRERLSAACGDDPSARRIRTRGFDLVVVDLSFISQRRVMGPIAALLADDGDLVSLVKPQFELGPGAVDARGLVRDASLRAGLREAFEADLAAHGLVLAGWMDSPLRGGDGNHEYLLHARRHAPGAAATTDTGDTP